MNDFLLESPIARTLIRSVGLPLPLPQPLERATGPWEARPLEGRRVVVGARGGRLVGAIARTLAAAGAEAVVDGDDLLDPFSEAGEAFSRAPRALDALADDSSLSALVFDASGIERVTDLRALYDFFHRSIGRLEHCGRLVVVGRPVEAARTPESAAARRALEGFVRSVAKEIGRNGSTANLVLVAADAADRLEGALRFILSRRSAFVSAQVVHVTARARQADRPVWERPLDARVALVTGAARGIGAATAERLAEEGARVVCVDLPSDAEELGRMAQRLGGHALPLDLTGPEAPETIAQELRSRTGGVVDVVVHNAGITRDRTLARLSEAEWRQALEVNLGAVVRVTETLLGGCLRDDGAIVCLSSVAGIAGNVGQTNYAASKAGLIGFVQHLAPALAGRGILVNAVAPGFIETRMTAAVPLFVREAGRRLSALGQGGQPRDVAEVITFLGTRAAAGLTGAVVRVCGGAFIGA